MDVQVWSGWPLFTILCALFRWRPQWLTKIAFGMDTYHDVSVKTAGRRLWQNNLFQFIWAILCFGTNAFIGRIWLEFIWEELILPQEFSVARLGHYILQVFCCGATCATGLVLCTLAIGIRFLFAVGFATICTGGMTAYFVSWAELGHNSILQLVIGNIILIGTIGWLCRSRDLELRRDFLINDAEKWLGRYHVAGTGGTAMRCVHKSATSCVYFAKDLGRAKNLRTHACCAKALKMFPNQVSRPVALKFIKTRQQLEQELQSRKHLKEQGLEDCVIPLRGVHLTHHDDDRELGSTTLLQDLSSDQSDLIPFWLERELMRDTMRGHPPEPGLEEFMFVLVLDAAALSAHQYVSTRRVAGFKREVVVDLFQQIVSRTAKLHGPTQNGLAHLDLKLRNVLLRFVRGEVKVTHACTHLYMHGQNTQDLYTGGPV